MPRRNSSRKRKKSKNRCQSTNNNKSSGVVTVTTAEQKLRFVISQKKNLLWQDFSKLVLHKSVLEVAILYLLIQNDLIMASNNWRLGDLGRSLFHFLVGNSNSTSNAGRPETNNSSRVVPEDHLRETAPKNVSSVSGFTPPQTVPRKRKTTKTKPSSGEHNQTPKSESEISSVTNVTCDRENIAPMTKPSLNPHIQLKSKSRSSSLTEAVTNVTEDIRKPIKSKKPIQQDKDKDMTLVTEGVVTKIPKSIASVEDITRKPEVLGAVTKIPKSKSKLVKDNREAISLAFQDHDNNLKINSGSNQSQSEKICALEKVPHHPEIQSQTNSNKIIHSKYDLDEEEILTSSCHNLESNVDYFTSRSSTSENIQAGLIQAASKIPLNLNDDKKEEENILAEVKQKKPAAAALTSTCGAQKFSVKKFESKQTAEDSKVVVSLNQAVIEVHTDTNTATASVVPLQLSENKENIIHNADDDDHEKLRETENNLVDFEEKEKFLTRTTPNNSTTKTCENLFSTTLSKLLKEKEERVKLVSNKNELIDDTFERNAVSQDPDADQAEQQSVKDAVMEEKFDVDGAGAAAFVSPDTAEILEQKSSKTCVKTQERQVSEENNAKIGEIVQIATCESSKSTSSSCSLLAKKEKYIYSPQSEHEIITKKSIDIENGSTVALGQKVTDIENRPSAALGPPLKIAKSIEALKEDSDKDEGNEKEVEESITKTHQGIQDMQKEFFVLQNTDTVQDDDKNNTFKTDASSGQNNTSMNYAREQTKNVAKDDVEQQVESDFTEKNITTERIREGSTNYEDPETKDVVDVEGADRNFADAIENTSKNVVTSNTNEISMLEQKQLSDFTEKQIIPAPPPPPPPGYLVKLAPDPGAHEKSKQPVDKPKMSAAEKALIKELETINDPNFVGFLKSQLKVKSISRDRNEQEM